jgi:hypothetical protein
MRRARISGRRSSAFIATMAARQPGVELGDVGGLVEDVLGLCGHRA